MTARRARNTRAGAEGGRGRFIGKGLGQIGKIERAIGAQLRVDRRVLQLNVLERCAAVPEAGELQVHVQALRREHGFAVGVREGEIPDIQFQGEGIEVNLAQLQGALVLLRDEGGALRADQSRHAVEAESCIDGHQQQHDGAPEEDAARSARWQ